MWSEHGWFFDDVGSSGSPRMQLGEDGSFEDLGLVGIGDSFEGISGAIGVAP